MSSIPLDYLARQKLGGTNMTYNYVEQFPVPAPANLEGGDVRIGSESLLDWMRLRICELAYTAWDMAPFANDLGDNGLPFVWDPARRAVLRAELDAAVFHLYGIDRDDTEYILSTFPIANRKDPDLSARVLDAYDRIATAGESGVPFVSTLDPPPGHGRRHEEPVA